MRIVVMLRLVSFEPLSNATGDDVTFRRQFGCRRGVQDRYQSIRAPSLVARDVLAQTEAERHSRVANGGIGSAAILSGR